MRRLGAGTLVLMLAWPAGAALDSKQKRGSVIGLSSPGRPWLSEPDGSDLAVDTERMSVLTYAAAVSPDPLGGTPVPVIVHHYEQMRREAAGRQR